MVWQAKRVRTETIKERAIYVYLPSLEMVDGWKLRAEKTGVSISKFVVDRVEDSVRKEGGGRGTSTCLGKLW